VAISLIALALLIPPFVVIALLIKATSKGPILYGQVRVGLDRREIRRRAAASGASGPADRRRSHRRSTVAHGTPFRIYKFRTMVVNAEEYGPQWSSKNDPRITSIGRVLRFTRLDETPQFVNVLLGQMTLVGPRPERPYFVDLFVEQIPGYRERLRVRPGITGQAQVNLDYDSNIDDVKKKLEQDLEYIRGRWILQDLKILFRTVAVVLTGKGAC
jgi:lipopolysaccharide/colanic/teichoic acid biosynthesis glycosyltransferase